MCIGIPMEIIEIHGNVTRCRRADIDSNAAEVIEEVDASLVGPQPVGSWLLVFLGAAREVLDPQRAHDMVRALQGLAAATAGGDFESFFADLIDREPELPAHLRPVEAATPTPDDALEGGTT